MVDGMAGKLIVLDGLDGSGKSTQAERVYAALHVKNEETLLVSYPDYAEPSSTLVKMYLNGEFSDSPEAVNAYAASSFYAVDRYASYMLHWRRLYENGWTILATRYTTSNAIHQMSKLPQAEWGEYLRWMEEYEYGRLGLPRPDRVLFLDMPRSIAQRLLLARAQGGEGRMDIHETHLDYLERCQETAEFAARVLGWEVISCAEGDKPAPLEKITEKILEKIEEAKPVC